MSIQEKKQALAGGKMEREGPESHQGKVTPPVKEEKKDTSIFEGRPYMEKGSFEYRLRDPKLYDTTGLGGKERLELSRKLFGSGNGHIKPGDIAKTKRELELGKMGKFKVLSQEEKKQAEKLIKGISGK